MAPIGLSPNQVLLTATTVDRWNFGMKNGLRLHGLSAALRTIKPAPGAEWRIGCGLSGPSQHQGGNSGDSHQAGVSSAHSGQRSGEPPAVPQGSSAPTQRQPTTSGTSGGGEETGGKASTSKDAAPSAPQRGESSDVGGVSEHERARAREDERNVRDFLRTLEESRLHEIVLDKALAYASNANSVLTEQFMARISAKEVEVADLVQRLAASGAATDAALLNGNPAERQELLNSHYFLGKDLNKCRKALSALQAASTEAAAIARSSLDVVNIELATKESELKAAQGDLAQSQAAYVLLTVDQSLQFHFENHPSAQSIYDKAMGWLAADNKQHIHLLAIEFRALYMADTETVTQWFDRLRRLAAKLIEGGQPVTEQDGVELAILGARHARFQALQQTVMAANGSMSYASVLQMYESAERLNLRLQPTSPFFPTYDVTIPVAVEAEVRVVDELELSSAPTARVPLTSLTPVGPSIRICVPLAPTRPTQGEVEVEAVELLLEAEPLCLGWSLTPWTLWQIPVSPLGVYQFDAVVGEIPSLLCVDLDVSIPPMSPIELWHKRFGHPGFPAMSQLVQGTLVTGMPIISNQQLRKFKESPCDACARGKAKRVPYHEPRRKTHSPLEIVHVDLMGPLFSQGLRGEYYLLVMVDDYSNWQAVVAMVTKGDSAFWIVNTLKAWMALLVGVVLGCLRSDQAKEFCTAEVEDFLKSVKARHELSSVYCPQQNGNAERMNGVVAATARTMLLDSKMTHGFWPYAFRCASYVRNRTPTLDGRTPYERFFCVVPDVSLLRIFGATGYVKLLDKDSRKGKLNGRALRGKMIGYAPVSKAWQLWLPDSHRIIESRDVDWYEGAGPAPVPGQDPFDGDFSLDGPDTAVNDLGPEVVTSPTPSDSPVGSAAGSDSGFRNSDSASGPGFHMQLRSQNQAPAVFPTVVTISCMEGKLHFFDHIVLSSSPTSDLVDNPLFLDATSASGSVSGGDTPAYISTSSDISYTQAMDQSNPHRDGWLLAMRDEMESLHAHGTWQLVKLPLGVVPIKNRWCFSFKHGDNGVVVRQKARVVAKGFLQRAGLDYDLTFAPVTSKSTLRTLLAGMVHNKMFARQLDIKTAFLNGVLEEELYMEQPQGFVVPGGWVCKLIKSLYGLKQSPRKWCEEVRRVLRIAGFTPVQADPALFIRLEPDGTVSWVLTYVDDFWLALHCLILYAKIVAIMRKAKWTVTEMGVPKVFLSIDCDLTLDSAGRCVSLVISQHNQIFGMLERYPIALGDETKQSPHVPMISGAVTKHAAGSPALPNNLMHTGVLSVFYLRKYPNLGIRYSHSSDFAVHAYSDASFGDDPEGRRSQTGMAILASGGVVHWASKRQITPAVSTGEAECQALAATARDVQWFKHLRVDLGLPCSLVTIQCDSTVANSWCAEVALVPRAKHIDIMHHYVRDLGMSGRIGIAKVDTTMQLADAFTKALEAEQFWFLNGLLGMVDCKRGAIPPTYTRPPR
eukprot:gene11701-biopygen15863